MNGKEEKKDDLLEVKMFCFCVCTGVAIGTLCKLGHMFFNV